MKCPSCAKEGKDVEMQQPVTNMNIAGVSSDHALLFCPENSKHWEVVPRDRVSDDRK